MPASVGHRHRLVDQRIGNRLQRIAKTRKPGSAAITAPKPYSEAVFIEASSAPPIAVLRAFGEIRRDRAPGEHEHREDADQQRALTAQIAATSDTACTTGWASPANCVSTVGA